MFILFPQMHNCLWVFCDDRVWLFNQVVQRPSACLASGSRCQSMINLTVLTVLTALIMMCYTLNNISQTISILPYFLFGAGSQSPALLCCRVQHPRRFSKCSISDYKEFLLKGGGSCLFNRPNKVRGIRSACCFQCIFIPTVMIVCMRSFTTANHVNIFCIHKELSCFIKLVLHTSSQVSQYINRQWITCFAISSRPEMWTKQRFWLYCSCRLCTTYTYIFTHIVYIHFQREMGNPIQPSLIFKLVFHGFQHIAFMKHNTTFYTIYVLGGAVCVGKHCGQLTALGFFPSSILNLV